MRESNLFCRATTFVLAAALAFSPLSTSFAGNVEISEAKRYFKKGQQHYDQGKFGEALASFQMAYHYKALPGFLFNIGQCHMELGNYQKATLNYERYLTDQPSAPNAKFAKQRLAEAEKKLGRNQPAPKNVKPKAPASTTTEAPEPDLIPLDPIPEIPTKESPKKQQAQKTSPKKKDDGTPKTESEEPKLITATLDDSTGTIPPVPEVEILTTKAPSEPLPVYEEWWFWTVTGTVVAASVGAIIYAAHPSQEQVVVLPSGSLGRIDRR